MTARRTASALLLTGSLLLAGCSLLPGDDEPGADDSALPSAGGGTKKAKDPDAPLRSTDWKTAARGKVAQGGTLRLAASALPANFNPQHADGAMSDAGRILAPTAGGAVRFTDDGGWEVDPDYAESVEVTDTDPLTVEVKLNPRAVWQGGTAITAKDMVAFWKAQNGSDDDFEVSSTAGYDDIGAVTTDDDDPYRYEVEFDRRTSGWPAVIYPRLPANVSSSPKLFNKAFKSRAISSNGPFVVSSIDPKTGTVTQVPNPRWWGAAPRLKQIVWRTGDALTRAKAYAAGELDAVDLEPGTYDTASGTGVVRRAAGVEWTHLTLNGGRGPLRDADVRRAVARAVDRSALAKASAAEMGAPGATIGSVVYVPGQRGYHDSSGEIAYDPAASAKLLEKAGYAKDGQGRFAKDGKPLTLTMPVPADTPTNAARAARVVADLKAAGVTVKLRTVDADAFFDDVVVALDFDLVTFAWRGSAFPVRAAEPRFYPVDSGQNFTGLGDKALGKAWDKADATLDDDKRYARVREIDEMVLDEVPIVPLSVTPLVMAVRPRVANYGPSQFAQPDWTVVGFTKKKSS
jgi:peptide/nickel transport system substrate-binding protein